jgi:hypothetical protein
MNFSLYNQYKKYGGCRRDTTIVSNLKQVWNQFNNQNKENIHIE